MNRVLPLVRLSLMNPEAAYMFCHFNFGADDQKEP